MKKWIQALMAVTLSASFIGCSSPTAAGTDTAAETTEKGDEVSEVTAAADHFMAALQDGDIPAAMGYLSKAAAETIDLSELSPDIEAIKEEIDVSGLSEKAIQEFNGYVNAWMDKFLKAMVRSYQLGSPEKISDTEYSVPFTAEVFNSEQFLKSIDSVFASFSADQIPNYEEVAAQVQKIKDESGQEATVEYVFSQALPFVDAQITELLDKAETSELNDAVRLVRENDQWRVSSFNGLNNVGQDMTAQPYDSHGISFAAGEGWLKLDGESNNYAAQYIGYGEAEFVQVRFREYSDTGYTAEDMPKLISDSWLPHAISGYESQKSVENVEEKADTIDGMACARIHSTISNLDVYELDIPIDTGDGNMTMIELYSCGADETENLFREIVIK